MRHQSRLFWNVGQLGSCSYSVAGVYFAFDLWKWKTVRRSQCLPHLLNIFTSPLCLFYTSGSQWVMLPGRRLCAKVFGGNRRHSTQILKTQLGGHAAALSEGKLERLNRDDHFATVQSWVVISCVVVPPLLSCAPTPTLQICSGSYRWKSSSHYRRPQPPCWGNTQLL